MIIYLFIKTKNYQSLKKFSKVLRLGFIKSNIKKVRYYPLLKKRTLFSILKSPHVNKTAQEQFEFKYSHRKIIISSKHFLKALVFIKRYFSNMFYDIKIKVLFDLVSSNLIHEKKKIILLDRAGEKKLKI